MTACRSAPAGLPRGARTCRARRSRSAWPAAGSPRPARRSRRRRGPRSARRAATSKMIVSPSRTAAIGPPRARLGRHVARHEAVRGAREAAVGEQGDRRRRGPRPRARRSRASISRMPGPPAGPSLRITTTSPGLDPARVTAAKRPPRARTRAPGRVCSMRSWPASFTTQPSGARLPRRMAKPPFGLIACERAAPRPGPRSPRPRSASSPIVRPVTVIASSWSSPASSAA